MALSVLPPLLSATPHCMPASFILYYFKQLSPKSRQRWPAGAPSQITLAGGKKKSQRKRMPPFLAEQKWSFIEQGWVMC